VHRKLYKHDATPQKRVESVRLKRFARQGFSFCSNGVLARASISMLCSSCSDNMAHLGGVINKNGKFIATIDTRESDTRFYILGPVRNEKQQAAQDLSSIRAAADGEATRLAKLQAMQLAAKQLRDGAKAAARGGIKEVEAEGYIARIKYLDNSEEKEIVGPRRDTERRAQADLAMLRGAALGHSSWADGICVAAMKAKALALMEGAEKEARVAMGIDQYLCQRMAHEVEDSDPETDGDDEGDGAPDAYDYSGPKVLEKFLAQ
jgi:hypothetical protein